jgi:hypothetical protein
VKKTIYILAIFVAVFLVVRFTSPTEPGAASVAKLPVEELTLTDVLFLKRHAATIFFVADLEVPPLQQGFVRLPDDIISTAAITQGTRNIVLVGSAASRVRIAKAAALMRERGAIFPKIFICEAGGYAQLLNVSPSGGPGSVKQ